MIAADASASGTAVELDGRTLTCAQVAAVARHFSPVRLSAEARARNAVAAEAIARLLARGEPLYGVSTGVGSLRTHELDLEERTDGQLRLLRSHAAGGGRPLAVELVRAAMVVRANQIGAGGAGVSPALLDALVEALQAGVTPQAREYGSVGTGDLTVLAEIALALLGQGRAWVDGCLRPAADALAARGLVVPALGLRDGLGMMSSNAATIGHAALVAVDARRLQESSLLVAALTSAALDADPAVLDPRVHAARPHPGQVAVAARLRELAGEPAVPAAGEPRRFIHDPYPLRALAQVEGAAADALSALERVLAVELNAAAENALIVDGQALSNGNFHAGALALALDELRGALAQSSSLVAARVSLLLEPSLSGLPAALADHPGPESGAMILEYTAQSASADVRTLAAPTAAQTVYLGGGAESHGSFAPLAARRATEAVHAAGVVVAVELAVAARALRMRGIEPAGREPRVLMEQAARRLRSALGDRPLNDDVEAARRLLLEEP